MPDMWLDVDTALAEVPVNIMPLIDSGDFATVEDAVAYDAGGMDLRWNFVTSGGSFTSTAVTPTTGGAYDWAHQGDGMYTIEIPASGGASINNDTEGYGWFSGKITGVLPFRGPIMGFRAAALNDAMCDGGDLLDVSVTQLAGDAQSLTDLKDFADAGYDPSTNKVQGVVLVDTMAGTIQTLDALDTAQDTQHGTTQTYLTNNLGTAGAAATEAGGDGDHLTAINLPNQTMDIVGNITGNLSGSVGSVTGNVGGSVASVTAGVTLANGAITNASLAGNMEIVFETDFATNYNTTNDQWVVSASAVASVTAGVTLADDAITAAKFDESTAFPITAANGSQFTEAGGDGDHLTAINLPNQTMDIVGNITGNLSGSVGSVTTVSDKTGYALSATGLNLVVPADPGTVQPVLGTSNIVVWHGYFAAVSVNRVTTNTADGETTIRNTADDGDLSVFPIADNGTEFESGPGT